jgi:outer membrane protein TolC
MGSLRRQAQRRGLRISAALAACSVLAIGACTPYRPSPLATRPDLGASVSDLKADVAHLRLEPLRSIQIDPSVGFTPLDVAVLAALNNPDLRAKRASLGVQDAQVFSAGLLPDPQVSANIDKPIAGPDKFLAYGVSPSIDIAALLARASAKRAAKFTAKQANLDVLWAEWTTAQQARQLAETALTDEARAEFLREILVAAADRAARTTRAQQHGDVSSQTAVADLAAKLDIETLLNTALHDAAKARRDLNALLGLTAETQLPLIEEAPAAYDPERARQNLASLPQRRPDLLALQAGYGAQDANLRKAIIAQFPLAQIAFAYARDPTPTTTLGFSAVMALPIFNGHRGDVKIAEATREQLKAEYQARLDQTDAEVRGAMAEFASATAQAAVLKADLPRLEAMLRPAPGALARGDIDSLTYLTLVQTVVTKRADLEDRELTARMAEIQLETALFAPPARAS